MQFVIDVGECICAAPRCGEHGRIPEKWITPDIPIPSTRIVEFRTHEDENAWTIRATLHPYNVLVTKFQYFCPVHRRQLYCIAWERLNENGTPIKAETDYVHAHHVDEAREEFSNQYRFEKKRIVGIAPVIAFRVKDTKGKILSVE